jgi:hypothetical protein
LILRVLLGAAAFVACAGCQTQSLEARSRFVEDGVSLEAPAAWSGERFLIDNEGVSPTGGLSITTDSERSRAQAAARMLVTADTLDKPTADEAITAATATYTITTDPKLTSIRCGQVKSRTADPAGCDALDVSLPAGKAEQPLSVTARSGNGRVEVSLGDAVREVDLHGSHGPIEVAVPATTGAVITIVADTGDDIVLRLPRDFAADLITLETSGATDTSAFPDVQSGKGRGSAGLGATSITLRSVGAARAATAGGRLVLLVRE